MVWMDPKWFAAKPSDHDLAVAKLINSTIKPHNEGFSRKLTIADRLAACRAELTGLREEDSLNLVWRDAEYYFHCRTGVAEQNHNAMKVLEGFKWNFLQMGQNVVKNVTQAVGADKWMRANPDNPNSPAGGDFWVAHGIQDGMMDRGMDIGTVRYHTRIYIAYGLKPDI